MTVAAETEGVLSIDGIKAEDCNECGTGYPGADKILFLGTAGATAAPGNVYVSEDGGSVWTVTTTVPFAATEGVAFLQVKLVGPETIRIIIGTGDTDVSAKAKISYADVVVGDLATVSAWTDTLIADTATGDVITAMLWARHDRLYLATDDFKVFINEHQGEDGSQTPSYTGATQIDAFAISVNGRDVYAAGATDEARAPAPHPENS